MSRQLVSRARVALTVLLLCLGAGVVQASPGVFINEIHYDNISTDTGEAIELAGPAGVDLNGWSIALYNGNPSALSVYDTVLLWGTFVGQTNGFGFLNFPHSGIQNGTPDGMALVDENGNVVQFLSYEGTFTAASGPAAGLTSTDIGVSEVGGTPVGQSLQLTGSGQTYSDFVWSGPIANTFGGLNAGQTFLATSQLSETGAERVAGTAPEPATLALISFGVAGLALSRRRKLLGRSMRLADSV